MTDLPRVAAALTRGADGTARLCVAGGPSRRLAEAAIGPALAELAAAGPLFLGVDAPLGGEEGLRETDRLCGLTAPRRHDPALADALAALHGHGLSVWPWDTPGPALAVEALGAMLSPDLAARLAAEQAPGGAAAQAAQTPAEAPADSPDDAAARLLADALAGLLDGDLAALLPPGLSRPAILAEGRPELLRAALQAPPPPLRDDCFAMPRGVEWIPVDDALARLRDGLTPVAQTEVLAPAAALGRVLAAPLRAARSNPPAANSAVDGYGFAHAAAMPGPEGAVCLPLVDGRAAAGGPYAGAVPPGMAIRILTGAILPEGVDTVVLEEDCAVSPALNAVAFRGLPKPGANARQAGEDVAAGEEALPEGRRLRPPDIALCAALGIGAAPVRRRLRVAVLSTGDELLEPGAPDPGPHRIYDANRPMLLSLLAAWGHAPVDLGRAPDREDAVEAALDRGAAEADAILTSGGASAGDEDHVSRLLRARGDLQSWRIALKPGRPLALAKWRGAPVFGLPGNPVAALVTAMIFARPALGALAGEGWRAARGVEVPAAFSKRKKPGRREYLRARLNAAGAAEVFVSEGSGRISGLAWAEGLVELPDGELEVRPGDPVRFLPYAEYGMG